MALDVLAHIGELDIVNLNVDSVYWSLSPVWAQGLGSATGRHTAGGPNEAAFMWRKPLRSLPSLRAMMPGKGRSRADP